MQKNNKFFDDLAKIASNAGGTLLEMKREMETLAAAQTEKMLRRMDLVTREDFNTARDMLVKARTEQDKLEKRVEALEKLLGLVPARAHRPVAQKTEPAKTGATGKKAPAKRPASKKPAAKKPLAQKTAPVKTGATGKKPAAKKPAVKKTAGGPAKKSS